MIKIKRLLKRISGKTSGFTLVELLLAAAILAFCLCGLMAVYVQMFVVTDLSRDFTIATNTMQGALERVKSMSLANITDLHNTTFNVMGYNGTRVIGRGVYQIADVVDSQTGATYGDLKLVRAVVSFRSRNRVYGEDANLNGMLDTGEDTDGNGRLSSPVEASTMVKNFTDYID
jgi:prepilin-type N-terminal cleavage/methylation domain-containing protein